MAEGFSKLEMVRMASGELGGNSSPQELAAFIESRYGMQIKPVIVTILLGSLQEQEHLAHVRQLAREIAEQGQIEAGNQGGKKANGGKRTRSKKSQLSGDDCQLLPAPDPPPFEGAGQCELRGWWGGEGVCVGEGMYLTAGPSTAPNSISPAWGS